MAEWMEDGRPPAPARPCMRAGFVSHLSRLHRPSVKLNLAAHFGSSLAVPNPRIASGHTKARPPEVAKVGTTCAVLCATNAFMVFAPKTDKLFASPRFTSSSRKSPSQPQSHQQPRLPPRASAVVTTITSTSASLQRPATTLRCAALSYSYALPSGDPNSRGHVLVLFVPGPLPPCHTLSADTTLCYSTSSSRRAASCGPRPRPHHHRAPGHTTPRAYATLLTCAFDVLELCAPPPPGEPMQPATCLSR